jgi:UPF0755 protein
VSALRRAWRALWLLAAALALAAGGLSVARAWLLAPAQPGAAPVLFEVPRGASAASIASRLEQAGLVRNARAFGWLARARGTAGGLRAGEYELSAAQSSEEILAMLAEGRVKAWEVVLPEGLRIEEVAQRLADAGLADAAAFAAFARDPASATALGVGGPTLEGYLFPETYRLPRGLSTREVAEAMVEQFLAVWRPLEPRAREQGLDMRKAVTLASIVEKETGAPQERPLIAAVFLNRLARGMRLESDPTVIYGIEGFDGNLRRVHLEDGSNAYNTYKIAALPPGPIANPGAAALRAVVEPAKSEALFFVSRNDGTHVFSRTFDEHVNHVNRHQRRGRSAP